MYKQQLTKTFKRPFYCGIINHALLEGKVIEGTHPKLVSPEIFMLVNNLHQEMPGTGVPHKKEGNNLPLKVFVKCGNCGEPFTGYIVKKKNLYYYKCRGLAVNAIRAPSSSNASRLPTNGYPPYNTNWNTCLKPKTTIMIIY